MALSEIPLQFVHIHIPKTAGTTFRSHCQSHLKLFSVHEDVDGMDYFSGLAETAKRKLPDFFACDQAILSGHYRYRDICPILTDLPKTIGLTTFVRDPVKRIISDYVYSTSEVHPGHAEFISEIPNFERYLEIEAHANKHMSYLSPSPDEDLEETLEALYTKFFFIGVSERYSVDMPIFFNRLGLTPPENHSANTSPDKQKAIELNEKYRAHIQHCAAKDIALYNAIVQRTPLPQNTLGPNNGT